MTAEIWTTTVETVHTPRGPRYRGITYVGEGTPKDGPAPRGAQVRYTTRLHTKYNEAREQARGRTIHHNIFHDGTAGIVQADYHKGIRCAEGRVRPVLEPCIVCGAPIASRRSHDAGCMVVAS